MSEQQQQQPNSGVVNLDDVSSQGRPFIKSGEYAIRCISVEKGKSRKGNDMLTMQYEICAPETVKVTNDKGEEVDTKIVGLQLTDWAVINDLGMPKIKSLHKVMGLPMSFNKSNPDLKQYLGKAVYVTLATDPIVSKDENTGEPILDENNQPITINTYKIKRFNRADSEHTMPSDSVAF